MVLATVYSGYSGHVYRGHSDIVATFPGTKYIYSTLYNLFGFFIKIRHILGPVWRLIKQILFKNIISLLVEKYLKCPQCKVRCVRGP